MKNRNLKQEKIIFLDPATDSCMEVFDSVRAGLQDGSVSDFMMIATKQITKKEAEDMGWPETRWIVRKYWYGRNFSCVKLLGLLEYLKMEIKEFILGRYGEYL